MYRPQLIGLLAATLMLFGTTLSAQDAAPAYYRARVNSNIRAQPTTNANKVGLLPAGEQVEVLREMPDKPWYQIRLADGTHAYIFNELLEPVATPLARGDETALSGEFGPSQAADDSEVYIIWPYDGEVIPGGEFWVRFGLRNMGVAPAGVEKAFTGHHHLLVNTDLPPLNQPIPNDDNHIHYGRGQTEAKVNLPPGTHTLQLLLGDHNHVPHNPPVVSQKVTVVVPDY